jgi:DNA invertase Pin-like site-specific DNA recombinase
VLESRGKEAVPVKVAIYARNSKPPKNWKASFPGEEPPGSWKTQLEDLRTWARRNEHEVLLETHDMVSGRDPNRPGWEQVMSEVRGHHVQAVAAVKLDRVMRSAGHFHEVAKTFLDLGVDLIFTDTSTQISKRDPFSKFQVAILASIAELELDLARERMWSVMEWREGRLYGPRSSRPAGAPRKYGEGHKFRIRNGRMEHDKSRCRACGGNGGHAPREGSTHVSNGVGRPGGSPAKG